MKKVIWLTGRSGSGKSIAANFFRCAGAQIIDADVIGHDILTPTSSAYNEIVRFFGESILNADNTINRKILGARVFKNKADLEKLNSITHKYIYAEMRARISKSENPLIIIDAALLPQEKIYDKILVISAPESERITRITTRDNISDDSARMRLASQVAEEEYIKIADIVIENSGTVPELEQKLCEFLEDINNIW